MAYFRRYSHLTTSVAGEWSGLDARCARYMLFADDVKTSRHLHIPKCWRSGRFFTRHKDYSCEAIYFIIKLSSSTTSSATLVAFVASKCYIVAAIVTKIKSCFYKTY